MAFFGYKPRYCHEREISIAAWQNTINAFSYISSTSIFLYMKSFAKFIAQDFNNGNEGP